MAWKGWICSDTLKDGCFIEVSKEGPMITEWTVIEVEDATAAL